VSAGLTFADVACVRGGRRLFEGISFRLQRGEAALVSGPNGIGKSSLIRMAAGLLAPAAGSIVAEGARALMTEAAALDVELPLASALGFWADIDARRNMVDAALESVGLLGLAQVPVRLLSTGQRRRATLARVVASGASIWLLDEPANGLDAESVATLEALMERHRADGGIIVAATHLPIALPDAREITL
jgi:heme exporter protein A